MTIEDLSAEDRDAIKAILTQWQSEGVETPLLPADVDLDGDGIVDAYGLENGEVVVVSGVSLGSTVYVADGES